MGRVVRSVVLAGGFLGVLVAAGCNRGESPGAGPGGKGPPTILKVTAATPVVKTVTKFTDVTGTLKAVERVEVRPQVSGYVEEVLFKDGAEVKRGDILVRIDPSLYKADLSKAEGELVSARAQEKLAGLEEARFGKLRGTSAVSQDEYDRSKAQKDVTAANVQTAQANVERAKKNLDWTDVRAKIDGLVDRIQVTKGNLVSGGTAAPTLLTVVVSTDPIYAYFDVDEETVLYYADLIKSNKFTSIKVKALPIEFRLKDTDPKVAEGYPFQGSLDFASSELNPATGSLTIRATIANPKPYKFTPGLFVRARISGAKVENAILVPDAAVFADGAGKVVYTVNADNKIAKKTVTTGPLSEGLRVVATGLTPTDRVVINGGQRVQDGVPVEVVPGEIKVDSK